VELLILLWPVSGWLGAYTSNKALNRLYPGQIDTASDMGSYIVGTFGGPMFLIVSLVYAAGWNHDAARRNRK
jgi:hypothetical protein